MTYVTPVIMVESQAHERDETDDLLHISSDRDATVTGGFWDNWDRTPGEVTAVENNSPTAVFIHSYRLRVFTTKPCILYSSQVDNFRLAKLAPGGPDTSFSQAKVADKTIKKWTTTVDGGYWCFLKVKFQKRLKLENAVWKLQMKNIDPAGNTNSYYSIAEFAMTYDATSTA